MKTAYYAVDAFTSKVFSGNPAGVCPLKKWLSDDVLQKIAFENNLSETAFFVQERDRFHIRWFSPAAEVSLCGHATLAAAHVLFAELGHKKPSILFDSKGGPLTVSRERGGALSLDFPALPLSPVAAPAALSAGLGAVPAEVLGGMDYVAVFDDERTVAGLRPDLEAFKKLDRRGVVVTAPGKASDYVLRCFGPKIGIAEDPVTGSAQCMLAPYWSRKMGNRELHVKQLSARGGELWCEVKGDRVKIFGRATLYLKGELQL